MIIKIEIGDEVLLGDSTGRVVAFRKRGVMVENWLGDTFFMYKKELKSKLVRTGMKVKIVTC